MTAALKWNLSSVDDYLAREEESASKHEYLGGVIYAMAGATNVHDTIATNAVVELASFARNAGCRAFNSDVKVRIPLLTHTRFYYPDALLTCYPNPPMDTFQDRPLIVIEVLSQSTRRLDGGEK